MMREAGWRLWARLNAGTRPAPDAPLVRLAILDWRSWPSCSTPSQVARTLKSAPRRYACAEKPRLDPRQGPARKAMRRRARSSARRSCTRSARAGCPIGECWTRSTPLMIMVDTAREPRLLQRQTDAGPLDPARRRVARRPRNWLGAYRRTSVDRAISTTAGQGFRETIAAIRARCSTRPRCSRRCPAQGRRSRERGGGAADGSNTIWKRAVEYLTVRRRALFRFDPAIEEGEGDRSGISQVGDQVGLGEEAQRSHAGHGDLRGERRLPHHRAYLQPTASTTRWCGRAANEFRQYEAIADAKGFLMVSASPLTRSSHHAGEDFARLKAARATRVL